MKENDIGTLLIKCAIEVHRELGPGLLETVYEVVLTNELESIGFNVVRQVPIPIQYKKLKFDEGFRADLIIENRVIVELKSVEEIHKSHRKQIQTYLKLTQKKLGYILNFGAAVMKDGIVRAVNGLEDDSLRLRVSARESKLSHQDSQTIDF